MYRTLRNILFTLCFLSLCPGTFAGSITVPNSSFETPSAPNVSPYAGPDMDSWQKTAQPYWYNPTNGPWDQVMGEFFNLPYPGYFIDNVDGYQASFLFALPGAGIFQDYDSIGGTNTVPTHDFNAIYQPGKTYSMTAGFIGEGGGMLEGVTEDMVLYFRDGSNNMVPIATYSVTNSTNTFPNRTHLVDFTVATPVVKATDPWAGKHIGIEIVSSVSFAQIGGYWDVDNVRLVETTIPQISSPSHNKNGQFSFNLLSEPGLSFQLLTTTNVSTALTNWSTLATVTNTTGVLPVTDTVNTNSSIRFYTAKQL